MTGPRELLAIGTADTVATVSAALVRARDVGGYYSSPADWRDEILYFLLPDRFSDGREGDRPLLTRAEIRALRTQSDRPGWSWKAWADSGKRWQGGTVNGVRGRLDYLRGLGVSTLWIGPVLRQRTRRDTYHGYGIQNFLEIDERFGTREDMITLVEQAHARDIRVVLDVIVNHSGDNWAYLRPDGTADENGPPYRHWPSYYGDPANPATTGWSLGWRDEPGSPTIPAGTTAGGQYEGVLPRDLQTPAAYARAGLGSLGDDRVAEAHAEHKRTDFFSLKDFALDVGTTLSDLITCYQHAIAIFDPDGFRVDTVKHMALEDVRNFCGAIGEFADSLGKRNLLLVGEVAGGEGFQDYFLDNLAVLQRNLSATLDIADARPRLAEVAKGLAPGQNYLGGFDAISDGFGSHRSHGTRHVSILDDHDHVFGTKLRFSAEIGDDSPVKDYQVCAGVAVQLFTLGIRASTTAPSRRSPGPRTPNSAISQPRVGAEAIMPTAICERPCSAPNIHEPSTTGPSPSRSRTSTRHCRASGRSAPQAVTCSTPRARATSASPRSVPPAPLIRCYASGGSTRGSCACPTPGSSFPPPGRSLRGPASLIGRRRWSSSMRTGRHDAAVTSSSPRSSRRPEPCTR